MPLFRPHGRDQAPESSSSGSFGTSFVPYSHLSCANWSHCQDLRAGDTCCVDSCSARISSCQETGKASGGLSFWVIITSCPEVSALMG